MAIQQDIICDLQTEVKSEQQLILEELFIDSMNLRSDIMEYDFLKHMQKRIDDIITNTLNIWQSTFHYEELEKLRDRYGEQS